VTWRLRSATRGDRDFLLALHHATLRDSVEPVWGWDEAFQERFFDERFDPAACEIVQVDGVDAGLLAVERREEEVFVASVQIAPEFQGQGVGSSILRSLIAAAHAAGKPLALQVRKSNPRATKL
jgi:ribosomal protein S18 acetylase RimI-like enzyme